MIKSSELYVIRRGTKRRAKEVKCLNCNKNFLKAITDINGNNPNLFCSKECFAEYKKKRVKLKCAFCQKEFERQKSKVKSKSGLFFCSYGCRNEAQKIKNGILKIKHYKDGRSIDYRKLALELYGKICSHCGYDEFEEGLDVHHIDGDKKITMKITY